MRRDSTRPVRAATACAACAFSQRRRRLCGQQAPRALCFQRLAEQLDHFVVVHIRGCAAPRARAFERVTSVSACVKACARVAAKAARHAQRTRGLHHRRALIIARLRLRQLLRLCGRRARQRQARPGDGPKALTRGQAPFRLARREARRTVAGVAAEVPACMAPIRAPRPQLRAGKARRARRRGGGFSKPGPSRHLPAPVPARPRIALASNKQRALPPSRLPPCCCVSCRAAARSWCPAAWK
jgi:hypothetical protein